MRLAPPPFWRTGYFEATRQRPDRQIIPLAEIASIVEAPHHTLEQPDGRTRLWGWSPSLNRWIRVIVLADGETVHNAFIDRDFVP